MLNSVHGALRAKIAQIFWFIANRLFDLRRSFEGKLGVAYGGPDLSDRNLAILEKFLSVRSERRRAHATSKRG